MVKVAGWRVRPGRQNAASRVKTGATPAFGVFHELAAVATRFHGSRPRFPRPEGCKVVDAELVKAEVEGVSSRFEADGRVGAAEERVPLLLATFLFARLAAAHPREGTGPAPGRLHSAAMKAVAWSDPHSLSIEDRPEPSASPGQLVVRMTSVGICGTDRKSVV